jgi:spore coat polysaccharide biosynthesis predicted glycosyltransferase SpsG
MGHLFRALNFARCLNKKKEKFLIVINDDEKAKDILKQSDIDYEIADINNYSTDWESALIRKYHVSIWVNDRLDTERTHAENVKKNNVSLATFDDGGTGAELADINFGLMPCNYNNVLKGKRIKRGIDYFIVNAEVDKYKKERSKINKIIVTLGGSDTYGVTLKVVEALKNSRSQITVLVGPSFQHQKELYALADLKFIIKNSVPSLIQEFAGYDLAITGGGITPFEANASGLPCIIIANEPHEVENGRFLEQIGSSAFLGYYADVDFSLISFNNLDIQKMSSVGLNAIHTHGAENIYNVIRSL